MASSKPPVGGDRGRQPGGAGQQPRPRLLPSHRERAGRPSSTWSSTTSPSGPASSTRCASGRACCTGSRRGWPSKKVHQKRLPAGAPDWVETVQLYFPRWGRTADELCVTELGLGDLGGADVDRRVPPVEQPAGRHREARRVADRPRPGRRVRLRHRAAGRARGPRGPRRARRGRLPEDLRRQGAARLRADPPRARLQGRPPRALWPSRARSSGGRRTTSRPPGGARTATRASSSSTTTRTPATTPSPRRTPSAACPTPGSRPPSRWAEVDDADPHDFTIFTVPDRFAAKGDLHEAIDEHVFDIRAAARVGRPRRGRGQGDTRRARARLTRPVGGRIVRLSW